MAGFRPMLRRRITTTLALVHLALALGLFAVATYDTLVTYPAWFAGIPQSLDRAWETGSGAATARALVVLGSGTILSAVATAVAGWRQVVARNLVLASAAIVLLAGGVTLVYFDPLSTILVQQGARVYTNEVLRAGARQFQQINWIRLANLAAALGLSLPGALRFLGKAEGRG